MKKLKKLSLKKEIEREAEALEKEVSGRKDLDHITVSEDMEEALFQKIQDYEYEKRAKVVYRKKKRRYAIIAVADGFTRFMSGFADGVDQYFAKIVLEKKKTNPVLELIAVIR